MEREREREGGRERVVEERERGRDGDRSEEDRKIHKTESGVYRALKGGENVKMNQRL